MSWCQDALKCQPFMNARFCQYSVTVFIAYLIPSLKLLRPFSVWIFKVTFYNYCNINYLVITSKKHFYIYSFSTDGYIATLNDVINFIKNLLEITFQGFSAFRAIYNSNSVST